MCAIVMLIVGFNQGPLQFCDIRAVTWATKFYLAAHGTSKLLVAGLMTLPTIGVTCTGLVRKTFSTGMGQATGQRQFQVDS